MTRNGDLVSTWPIGLLHKLLTFGGAWLLTVVLTPVTALQNLATSFLAGDIFQIPTATLNFCYVTTLWQLFLNFYSA